MPGLVYPVRMLIYVVFGCFLISTFVAVGMWGFWTAPFVRKNKKKTAPVWVILLGLPVYYDFFLAVNIRTRGSSRRKKMWVQGVSLFLGTGFFIAWLTLLLLARYSQGSS